MSHNQNVKDLLKDQEATLNGSGNPTSIIPEFIGQHYINTDDDGIWVAKSLSIGDFVEVGSGGGGSGAGEDVIMSSFEKILQADWTGSGDTDWHDVDNGSGDILSINVNTEENEQVVVCYNVQARRANVNNDGYIAARAVIDGNDYSNAYVQNGAPAQNDDTESLSLTFITPALSSGSHIIKIQARTGNSSYPVKVFGAVGGLYGTSRLQVTKLRTEDVITGTTVTEDKLTSDATITSTGVWEDTPLSFTIDTIEDERVLLTTLGTTFASSTPIHIQYRFSIDSESSLSPVHYHNDTSNFRSEVSMTWMTPALSAGQHTITLQWQRVAGSANPISLSGTWMGEPAILQAIQYRTGGSVGEEYVDREATGSWDFLMGDLTLDGNWHDLDLSSILPIEAANQLIHIRAQVSDNGVGNKLLIAAKSGDEWNTSAIHIETSDSSHSEDLWVKCDADRKIKYTATNTIWTSINLVIRGWMRDAGSTSGGGDIEIQKDDVQVTAACKILNFEGSGIDSVVDDGSGKTTVTVSGGSSQLQVLAATRAADYNVPNNNPAIAIPDLEINVTTNAGEYVQFMFSTTLRFASGGTDDLRFYYKIDADANTPLSYSLDRQNNVYRALSFCKIIGPLSAGNHTIKLMARKSAGTLTIIGTAGIVPSDCTMQVARFLSGGEKYVDRGDPAAYDWTSGDLTKDDAWHDLDISGIVPLEAANQLILFRMALSSSSGNSYLLLREKGKVNELNAAYIRQNNSGDFLVKCDNNRTWQYKVSGGAFITFIGISIKGWWKFI